MSVTFVTGGAGYVGSHTVVALADSGYDVVVYDNLSAGHAEAVERIAAAFPHRSITLVRGDILDASAVESALRASNAGAVLHFAAHLSVGESVTDPAKYYRNNVTGTLTLLGAMTHVGITRFIFSSTCATFGEPVTPAIDERHPQTPVNAYGESKLAVERALPHFERAHGLRSVALRYFNAAGAHPDGLIGEDHHPEEHLIPRALAAATGGPPLIVFGDDYPTPDGTCIRDYVHVSDLASAHVASLRALELGAASAVYNLGSEHGASVREVLDRVAEVTGRPVPFTMGPRRPGDPARLVAAGGAIRRELGWAPAFADLDAIVTTAWNWARHHPHGYRPPTT
jgi:UDP-glucose-4-epimerase GalE